MGSDQGGAKADDGNPPAIKTASAHGEGFCSVVWCKVAADDAAQPSWHALTTGQDGKLVLRRGDESLAAVRVSGDHEKPSHSLVVVDDGKAVASVEGEYVNVSPPPHLRRVHTACRHAGAV